MLKSDSLAALWPLFLEPFLVTLARFFVKSAFLIGFSRHLFSDLLFLQFLDAIREVRTPKTKQKQWTVVQNQGSAKSRNGAPRINFWLHFGRHLGTKILHFARKKFPEASKKASETQHQKKCKKRSCGPCKPCETGAWGPLKKQYQNQI